MAHRKLEGALNILGTHWNLVTYAKLLARFSAFHTAFETHLANFPEVFYFYQGRQKTLLLTQDINALNQSVSPEAHAESAEFLRDWAATVPAVWGMLYVIEGSTLGGQVVTRHFQQALGLTPQSGGAYFAGYRADTGPRWQEFLQKLATLEMDQSQQEQACVGATKLFGFFQSYLLRS